MSIRIGLPRILNSLLDRFQNVIPLDETCLQDKSNEDEPRPNVSSFDEVLLHRLKSSLAGVPPPPQLTYPEQKVEDIVNQFKDIESWTNFENNRTGSIGCFYEKINCDQDDGRDCAWPNVKLCVFFDISYNLGELSERVVELCDKYRERYVGCETSSFVTASSPTEYHVLKKNRRKATSRSPRRSSYQTHRRKVFSSSSLQEACKANTFGVAKKTILLPRNTSLLPGRSTRKEVEETKRALFLTADERNSLKLGRMKRSPSKVKSMEIRRSLWLQRKLPKMSTTPRKQTQKKQSTPGKQTPMKNCGSSKGVVVTPSKRTPKKQGTPRKLTSRKSNTPKKLDTRKDDDLYRVTNKNGKRSRSDLDSGDDTLVGDRLIADSRSDGDSGRETHASVLSDSQRRKLLWAVSAALKQVGVRSSHQYFRVYCRKLFKICRLIWTCCPSYGAIKQGISERMLALASEHVNAVINETLETNTDNVELWSQDSNSCDFFLSNGDQC